MRIAAVLWLVCLSRPAFAACPEELLPDALVVRLDASALQTMSAVIARLLPRTLELPEDQLFEQACAEGSGSLAVTVQGGTFALAVDQLTITPGDGTLAVDMQLGLAAASTLDMQLCTTAPTSCPLDVDVAKFQVHAVMAVAADDCALGIDLTMVDLEVDPLDVAVTLKDCGSVGEVVEVATDVGRNFLLDLALSKAEEVMREMLPTFVEGFTSGIVQNQLTMLDIELTGALSRLTLTPTGVTVYVAADAAPAVPKAACLPSNAELPPRPAAPALLDLSEDGPIAIAVSQPFVERAIAAAWYAGWMCFDSRTSEIDLASALATILPSPTLHFTVAAPLPPSLSLIDGPPSAAMLTLPAVHAEIALALDGSEPSIIAVDLSGSINASIDIDPQTRGVLLVPNGIVGGPLSVTLPTAELGVSEENIKSFIDNFALPNFGASLSSLPVTAALFSFSPMAATLDDVSARGDYVIAKVRPYLAPVDDATAPETFIVGEVPALVAPTFVLPMASMDDTTQTSLVRHFLTVDGVAEESPRAGQQLVIEDLLPGPHELSLAAVDLADNRDATPLVFEVVVDELPPVIEFIEMPIGAIDEYEAYFRFSAKDDLSNAYQMSYRYTAGIIGDTNVPDVPIAAGELGTSTEFSVSNLPNKQLVRVTVYARDAAGNETELDWGFAVDRTPTMGCAAATVAPWCGLLLALRLMGRRRRS